tara:strand:- start:380 stop:799 length:420 start_codon:yes stop_codon:yes gene_type:complete
MEVPNASSTTDSMETFEAGTTPLESLIAYRKESYTFLSQIVLRGAFFKHNHKEILESLEVVETSEYTDEDGVKRYVCFYKFYVGSTTFRDTEKFVLRNGKYYVSYAFLSDYKTSDEEKKLAEKEKDWKNIDEMILQFNQ